MADSSNIIVVGSGPAGCAAAIHCAQRGLAVTLLDCELFPRERPGETLHPGIEPLLKQLGVAEHFLAGPLLRHSGHWADWGGERRFVPFGSDAGGPWLGFQAWRADFDAILLERARELGVTVRQPCRALRPLLQHRRVSGVLTSDGPLQAQSVVDAAGGRHWLARHVQLPIANYSPRLIARFGYMEGECPERDECPAIAGDQHGWTWTARVKAGLYHWTRLALDGPTAGRKETPPEFERLAPRGPTRSADVTWRVVTAAAGPGYFLAGDAAAVLDPASSHGVLKAIMSGILAGHFISQIVSGTGLETELARSYARQIREWFLHDVRQLRELYARLRTRQPL